MIIELIKASELITNKWSGGTTTQLAIYPKEATYQDLNFLFRLSTATIEAEKSTFTKLPSISRKIMILDGEIKIEHQNQYSKILKKFEQDSFKGDWNTKSFGKATDFNLMTIGNTCGQIEKFSFDSSIKIKLDENVDLYVFYMYSGEITFSIEDKNMDVKQGDLIQISFVNENQYIKLSTNQPCEFILTKISLNK